MGHRTIGGYLRKRLSPAFLVFAVTLFPPVLIPGGAAAAELSLSSRSYGLLYEREQAGGEKNSYAPLYEYLSADVADLGGKNVSLHFYGWGRVDLADDSGSDSSSGEVSSFYAEYLHPEGNAQAKLGRFFLTEGSAMDTIDGVFVKATTPVGVGVSLYGGVPVEYSILAGREKGDSIYGARVFYARPGIAELGVSYLNEDGSTEETDRELYGGDLWVQVAKGVELTGRASYNRTTHGMASQRYAVRVMPGAGLDISAGYESYDYEGLFGPTLNPAFVFPALDNTDEVRTIFGVVDWGFAPGWTLEVSGKHIRHDKSDPGDANRVEAGLRRGYNKNRDMAGLSAAFVAGDRAENEYREMRAFATWSPDRLRFTLDGIVQNFKQEISGKKNAYQVVATAGYRLLEALQLSGSLTCTRSPSYDYDYAGLVRLSYDLSVATGGKK
ncbi:MAG: hypothetical protein IH576_01865 [Deltaproteobacteria bacterium]|nr:hypothetical protein [Deltaproteobacteria bacterium]